MNRFAGCDDPLAEKRQRIAKMIKSAPMGSRHQRMLWAAHKIAGQTGTTEGAAYRMLLITLIEAEGRLDLAELNDLQMTGT